MQNPHLSINFFVVFEPSYALGCLATLSSLARQASAPVAVDLIMRDSYRGAAQSVMTKLREAHGEKIQLREIVVPPAILEKCDSFQFKAHFIPEILFRLFYFDMAEIRSDYVVYLDIDMLVLRDPYLIAADLTEPALLHAVEVTLLEHSRPVTPPRMTRYLNSGFMVFDARNRAAIAAAMHRTQEIVESIASRSLYLDQDAVNIAFYDDLHYLPQRWNFTLQHFSGYPLPSDIVILHASGSRKPWFFRGGHPFTRWYEQEADLLNLGFFARHDFWWVFRRLLKKAKMLVGR